MKKPLLRDKSERFAGPLRHYHRAGAPDQRPWSEWIEGTSAKSGGISWLKVVLVGLALLGLAVIIAGLIIELR